MGWVWTPRDLGAELRGRREVGGKRPAFCFVQRARKRLPRKLPEVPKFSAIPFFIYIFLILDVCYRITFPPFRYSAFPYYLACFVRDSSSDAIAVDLLPARGVGVAAPERRQRQRRARQHHRAAKREHPLAHRGRLRVRGLVANASIRVCVGRDRFPRTRRAARARARQRMQGRYMARPKAQGRHRTCGGVRARLLCLRPCA